MTLNPVEKKVLRFLAGKGGEWSDHGYCSFAPIMRATKADRKTVRRACRSLKRKGLTTFGTGLWTDDGQPYGSGYACTDKGLEAVS